MRASGIHLLNTSTLDNVGGNKLLIQSQYSEVSIFKVPMNLISILLIHYFQYLTQMVYNNLALHIYL